MSPLRLLADEDFRGRILNALVRAIPALDIVRAQDVGLAGAPDTEVLRWAAENGRVLLTHDRATMPAAGYARVMAGEAMPGMCVVRQTAAPRLVVDDLLIVLQCSRPQEWPNQIHYVPL